MSGTPGRGRLAGAPTDADGGDDITTAEAGPPVAQRRAGGGGKTDGDDPTLQQKVAPPKRSPPPTTARPPPLPSSRPGPPSQLPQSVASSIPPRTVTGPIASTVPVATERTSEIHDVELEEDDDELLEDSITTMAPRVSVSSIAGLSVPGSIEILTVDDELLDETEVRTLPGNLPLAISRALRSAMPRPAAGVPASALAPARQPGELDEAGGVATQAPPPRVPSAPDELETRPGLAAHEAGPARPRPAPRPGRASLVDDDIVTTRALVPEPFADDGDSVTTQAPAFSDAQIAAAIAGPRNVADATIEDVTEGTTKKVRHPHEQAVPPLPGDGEGESITTQAPAPLTNLLRVIAADGTPENGVPSVAEDEPGENRTEVMANAPLQRVAADLVASAAASTASPPTGPGVTVPHSASTGARDASAPQLTASSEGGMKGPGTEGALLAPSPQHASHGAAGVQEVRPSGVPSSVPTPTPRPDERPFAETEAAFPAQPSVHDVDLGRGPRYGLVVAIVAAVSFVVPVTLFVVLRGRPEELAVGVPSEAATELQQHDATPRGKFDRKALAAASASASAAAAASASASAAASARGKPPHHR